MGATRKIHFIERIQNPILWDKFQQEKANLKKKWGVDSEVKMLWHGHKGI